MKHDAHYQGKMIEVRPDLTPKEIASILVADEDWGYYYKSKLEMLTKDETFDDYVVTDDSVYRITNLEAIVPQTERFVAQRINEYDGEIEFEIKFDKKEHLFNEAIVKALGNL